MTDVGPLQAVRGRWGRTLAFLDNYLTETLLSVRGQGRALWKDRATPVIHVSFWVAAGIMGTAAVLYARLVEIAQHQFSARFADYPGLVALAMPVLFAVAVGLVRLAPEAAGSGIPQVLRAIEQARRKQVSLDKSGLVSVRTAMVKIASTTVGLLGGASVGREGPTVQLAATGFALIGRWTRRYVRELSMQSYLVAGAAAGIAAAFNTPLAGVTFALEELAEDLFSQFKQFVMITVIIGGICAQALAGDYLYFGRPNTLPAHLDFAPAVIVIGVAAGILGGGFARAMAWRGPKRRPHWLVVALVLGGLSGGLAWLSHGATAGSGYEVTRKFMEGQTDDLPLWLFPAKTLATLFSYHSGMAGGFFAPTLAIGASLGSAVGSLVGYAGLRTCALVGMASFFAAVVQAPLTAIIIVTEMTDKHILIFPLMASALIASMISKRLMPTPLYRYLAQASEPPPPSLAEQPNESSAHSLAVPPADR